MVSEVISRLDESPRNGDAFGIALLDAFTGKNALEIIERDDGLLIVNQISIYFAPPDTWSTPSRKAIEQAGGRVLDIGCGSGRHAIFLQENKFDVIGLDTSPGALEVARRQGLQSTFLGTPEKHLLTNPTYDTFLLMGNNLCLLGSLDYAPSMLHTLAHMAAPKARIIGQGVDPYAIHDPLYLGYYERNREKGNLPGQIRYRVRYKNIATPWFDYLYCSPHELEQLTQGSDWRIDTLTQVEGEVFYIAILRKIT